MSRSLVDHTRFERTAPGVYERINDREWYGAVSLFGGYAMALVLTALRLEVDDPAYRPRTLTHQFARPLPEGPCRVEIQVEREGRRSKSLTARLHAGGKLCGLALASFHTDASGLTFDDIEVPDVEPVGPDEEPVGFGLGAPCHDRARMYPRFGQAVGEDPRVTGGWLTTPDPAPTDEVLLIALSDMWLPAAINDPDRATAMVSFEQAAQIDAHEVADGPLLLRASHGRARGGLIDEDIDIWDREGRLVLRARQLRVLPGDD